MQTKNNAKASNGDIGYIRKMGRNAKNEMVVTIEFSGDRIAEYGMEEMGHMELAYATTVHKAVSYTHLDVYKRQEDLVAEIFHVKTGFEIYQVKKMFYHSVYTYMLADIDYFIRLPNGKTAILEIKTTNYNAKDHWWCDGQEIVPVNYEIQGRHYMCVMNMDEVYFCCLYGNNENEVIIRRIGRDPDYEAEMIALEGNFWNDHVLTQTPPPYTEDGELTLESVRRHFGPADENAPEIELSVPLASSLVRYTELQAEKSELNREVKRVENEMKRLQGRIVAEMGRSCTATANSGGVSYSISYKPTSCLLYTSR